MRVMADHAKVIAILVIPWVAAFYVVDFLLQLGFSMRKLGIEHFSLTPHVAYPAMPNSIEDIQTTLANLKKACPV